MKKKAGYFHYLSIVDWNGEIKEYRLSEDMPFMEFTTICQMVIKRELRSVQSIQLQDIRHVFLFELTVNPQLYRPNQNVQHLNTSL